MSEYHIEIFSDASNNHLCRYTSYLYYIQCLCIINSMKVNCLVFEYISLHLSNPKSDLLMNEPNGNCYGHIKCTQCIWHEKKITNKIWKSYMIQSDWIFETSEKSIQMFVVEVVLRLAQIQIGFYFIIIIIRVCALCACL